MGVCNFYIGMNEEKNFNFSMVSTDISLSDYYDQSTL